jgi:uncharacterized protein (TIGR02466 family)
MNQRDFNIVFPTVVVKTNISRNFTDEELSCISNLEKINNIYNYKSLDSSVLDKPILKELKHFIDKELEVYFKDVIKTTDNVVPYVTQSWCNWTYLKQSHHQHRHQNSFLSGVLYIKSLKEKDSIKFTSPVWQTFSFNIKEYNALNSQSMSFAVESGDLLLFPSYLEHSVETKVDNKERISLAFNTFIKGNIGSEVFLTKLSL